ncbi:MAG: hypothetical protein LBS97_07240 [Treponema sp.]|jgi:hypothetical protein|nr:hypothetical protein [Treponema sp.]
MKKILFVFGAWIFCVGTVSAQSFGSVDNDKADTETVVDEDRGFTAQVDIDTNLFQMTDTTYSDATERYKRTDSFLIDNYPLGGFNVLDDTNVAFGYNGAWYGGNLSLNSGGLGGVKAWLSFLNGKIKITAGNDIGYGYADSQGADAGLRVYDDNVRTNNDGKNDTDDNTVDSSKNPDNITQDKGLLFEFDLAPWKIAIGGGGNITDMAKNIGSVMSASNNDPIYGYNFQYGANIGGKVGDLAKLNGAYILQSAKNETRYEYNAKSDKIVAQGADAETTTHLFGVYGSMYPLRNDTLGFTLGYAGVFTQYLEEFSVDSQTTMPQVFKNGINLTARYKTDKFTIKTDHNYSFWSDKNYKIYYLYKPDAQRMKDYGLLAKSNDASNVSDVSHTFLWNGLGASYHFTPVVEGSAYVRNLIRTDETPEYKMVIDYFSLELKSTFRLHPSVECYAGITYHYTGRTVSESLPKVLDEFGAKPAKETVDSVNMIQIPVGFTVRLK